MEFKNVIKSQYHASLAMLKQVIDLCPDDLWDDEAYKNRFWSVAYHGLFYGYFYLHPTEEDYVPWPGHVKDLNGFDKLHTGPSPELYTKAQTLDFWVYLTERVDDMVDVLDLEAPSGFSWLPFDKLELQFYSIRHIMLHTGELAERLGRLGEDEIRWVGKRD